MRVRSTVFLVVLVASASGVAAQGLAISTTATDPALTCSVLDKKLPKSLSSIRRLGTLRREKVVGDADYCEHLAQECDIHTLEFHGLKLQLLAHKRTKDASALVATFTTSRWTLLQQVRVGQSVEVLEKHYGVSIPRNISPVTLEGECTPLTVWHAKGQVTKLMLDCQACI